MVGPIVERGPRAGKGRKLAVEKVPERGARHVDIAPVAIDEVHRHVERVVHIALETHARLEGEGQEPGAIGVGVAPDLGAVRLEAVGLAVGERRIGEECGGDRLERKAHAQFGDHVPLIAEIHVHLHRRGAEHHVEPMAPSLRHIARHDAVALLRHHRGLAERPFRGEADAKKADAELPSNFADLDEMVAKFLIGLVHVLEGRAGQFELAAGLEADRAALRAVLAAERDDVALLRDRIPAEAVLEPLEQRADAAFAFIRDRVMSVRIEAELLVLGADAPFVRGLGTLLEISDELVT